MEKDKILKVLEEVSSGTKLYSATFGKLEFNGIVASTDGPKIELATKNQECITYFPDGKYRKEGEITLCPSKEMRNWDKFAWKKGDVLVDSKGVFCIFKGFSGYPYTTFIATFINNIESIISGSTIKVTQEWHKASSEDAKKYIEYINANLKKVDRKLNLETLEVEKTEFKGGDILTCPATNLHDSCTFILKEERISGYTYYAAIVVGNSEELYIGSENVWCGKEENVRYATEAEKMKLFDALTKQRKYWNAEKKIIEEINQTPKRPMYKKISDPPEYEFEPFEKVLVRDGKTDVWTVDLYGSKRKVGRYNYILVGGLSVYCIPYKGNEHLLDTTNNPD